MAEINLNLLNKKERKEIISTIKYIKLINSLIFILVILTIMSLILLGTKKYINNKISGLEQMGHQQNQSEEINLINQKIKQLKNIQKDYIKWSRLLKNFFELTPGGIKLTSVDFDKEQNKIYINGHATTRQSFLEYKRNLQNADMIKNIDSPITNLLHEADFNFKLTGELKL